MNKKDKQTKSGRKFARHFLKKRSVVLSIIGIVIIVLILNFFIGAISASKLEIASDNVEYNIDDFTSCETVEYDGNNYNMWVAQNDNYVMYIDESTTIATLYVIEDGAKTGNTVTQSDGIVYPEIDVTKCGTYYSTAQDVDRSDDGNLAISDSGTPSATAKNANIVIQYADTDSGKLVPTTLNSMENSVRYFNDVTKGIEQHYYINYTTDAVQILYTMGRFSAGSDFLPKKMFQVMYEPYREDYEPGGYYNADGTEFNQTKYDEDVQKYYTYLSELGVSNPENATDTEIKIANSKTLEGRFSGNISFNSNTKSVAGTKTWYYTGKAKIYTYEGLEYIQNLFDTGVISGEVITDSSTGEPRIAHDDSGNANVYWQVNIDDISSFANIANVGTFFNSDESPLTWNPYLNPISYKTLVPNIYVPTYDIDTTQSNDGEGIGVTGSYYKRIDTIPTDTLKTVYKYFYEESMLTDIGGNLYYYYDDFADTLTDETFSNGGFCAMDEEGNYLYDDTGTPIREFYDGLDTVAEDNALFGLTSATSLPVFNVGIQLALTEDGLQATIMSDSLVDAQNIDSFDLAMASTGKELSEYNNSCILDNIEVLPYMTYTNNVITEEVAGVETEVDQEGMIIVPDGSGAIIEFNNGKEAMGASGVNQNYYGKNLVFTSEAMQEETEDLTLGMYGFLCTDPDPKGILAVLEKGGNSVYLRANTTSIYSAAFFQAYLRTRQSVSITKQATFTKWATNMAQNDFEFTYIILKEDELNYSSVAKRYATYLISRDNIEMKDDTDETVVNIDFLGAFEKYQIVFGIKSKVADSLTTFEQAGNIITELSTGVDVDGTSMKVNNFNVSYLDWTSEEMEYQYGGSINVSSKLGGISDLADLTAQLRDMSIDFYPETYITTTKGYDKHYGNLKYTARDVSNNTASAYQFNVAIQRQDKSLSGTDYISALYYNDIAENVDKKTQKIATKIGASSDNFGYYLVDLGNLSVQNYTSNKEIYGQDAIEYQLQALDTLSSSAKIEISCPYDYAFKYVDFATNVPMTSTILGIYDEAVPFYQLVVSGMFDYTGDKVNGTSNKGADWYYIKSLETGSNLNYIISATDPVELLDTDYTNYYQAYYSNWKKNIVEMATKIDETGIHAGELTKHEVIAKDISKVTYTLSSGETIKLYINTTSTDYVLDATHTIPAYSYLADN